MTKRRFPRLSGVVFLIGFAAAVVTQAQDKSQYNLFNPVPQDQLRPLVGDSYDRVPDATTIDAGHVQVDTALINYYHISHTYTFGFISEHYSSADYSWQPRVTLGLLNNLALFAHPSFYNESATTSYNVPVTPGYGIFNRNVFGNVNVGLNYNLWGNDKGWSALALSPFISIPTDHGSVMGGMDIPLTIRLPYQFRVKLYADPVTIQNNLGTVYGEVDTGLSIHKMLARKFDVFWYLNAYWISDPRQPWYGYSGFGLGYEFTQNIGLYGGIGFGLDTPAAYDYNPRLSLVWRF